MMKPLTIAALVSLGMTLSAESRSNDRDLLATSIPAASCIEGGGINGLVTSFWVNKVHTIRGMYIVTDPYAFTHFECGLQVNNIEKSNPPSTDNDISKVRVLYRDSDGLGSGTVVRVTLYQTTLLPSAALQSKQICHWDSNVNGTGSTGYARATFPCVHDIPPGAFYHFDIQMYTTTFTTEIVAGFGGIDFPK